MSLVSSSVVLTATRPSETRQHNRHFTDCIYFYSTTTKTFQWRFVVFISDVPQLHIIFRCWCEKNVAMLCLPEMTNESQKKEFQLLLSNCVMLFLPRCKLSKFDLPHNFNVKILTYPHTQCFRIPLEAQWGSYFMPPNRMEITTVFHNKVNRKV